MSLAWVFIIGGPVLLWLLLTGRPLALMWLYLGIVIPGWLILQFFPGGLFSPDFFEEIQDFFIDEIGARFFPNKPQKLRAAILDDIEQSDALLTEAVRRQRESSTKITQLHPEQGDDISGGGTAVQIEPGKEII